VLSQALYRPYRFASLLVIFAVLLAAAAGSALANSSAHPQRSRHASHARTVCYPVRHQGRHPAVRGRHPAVRCEVGDASKHKSNHRAKRSSPESKPAESPSSGTGSSPLTKSPPVSSSPSGESSPPSGEAPSSPSPISPTLPSETWEGFSASNPMPAGRTPGSSSSPFNQRVANPAVLSNSSAMVAWLLSHNEPNSQMPGNEEPQDGGGHPTVYAANTDPLVELVVTESWGPNSLQGRKIKIPAQAHASLPGPPADAHLEIVLAPDEVKVPGETVELWRTEPVKEGKLRFAWGSPGNIDGSLLGSGATASAFDLSAGVVRAPELKAGVVPHALCASIPQAKSIYVYPASHTDGSSTEGAAPAMGQRFYLAYSDPEIEALPVASWKKAVLKALAHYGFYVCDSGNDTLGFELESSVMYTAFGKTEPFSMIGKEQNLPTWQGKYVFNFSQGVDWTRLRAIAPPAE
jgi:hypothetical protein